MGLKTWISKIKIGLSNPKYRKRGDLMIESDDDFEADVIAECYRTKKPVMRSRVAPNQLGGAEGGAKGNG